MLIHFQLEVDYYSNEANKNKSINKKQLKYQIVMGIVLATTTCHTLLLGLESTLLLGLVVT